MPSGSATTCPTRCTPPEVLQATSLPNLAFMSSGKATSNAADLLAGARLFSLLSTGLEVFNLIVIDGPPVVGLADVRCSPAWPRPRSWWWAPPGAQRRNPHRPGAPRYARGNVIGTVLTKYDAKRAGYGYAYGYGYGGYGYGPTGPQAMPPAKGRAARLTNARESA